MMGIRLLASAGDGVADHVLRRVLGLFERVFPGRPRAYWAVPVPWAPSALGARP